MNKILKARIVEKFGSQWVFAQEINEHEATVSRVIRGRLVLSAEKRARWAKVLGKSSAELFN